VSAARQGDRIVVRVPARMARAEVDRWVGTLVERVLTAERRARPSDAELMARARELSAAYLDGAARPVSVRWTSNQLRRWGSCTPVDGAIRLSHRLAAMPADVRDYVLLHELAHLLHPDHGRAFRALLARYPAAERAEAFLAGWSAGHAARD
jgi:predicted metal-dependent hydrolase